jgi:hypothetical protein
MLRLAGLHPAQGLVKQIEQISPKRGGPLLTGPKPPTDSGGILLGRALLGAEKGGNTAAFCIGIGNA